MSTHHTMINFGRSHHYPDQSTDRGLDLCSKQWEPGEQLLQVHHLTRDELSDAKHNDVGRTVH